MLIFLGYTPFPSLKTKQSWQKNVVTLVTLSHFVSNESRRIVCNPDKNHIKLYWHNTKSAVSSDEKAVSSDKKAVSSSEKAVSKQEVAVSKEQMILTFCVEPKSMFEICKHLGLKDRYKVKKRYIDPLLNKSLSMTEPESPNSPSQKYVTI